MMLVLWLVGLSAAFAHAESLPWISLDGPWKFQIGDDPHYAALDFDDSSWGTVPLPGNLPLRPVRAVPGQYLWLRRTVDLSGAENQALVLSLGKLTENYQVFVNGELLASVGDFTREKTQLARPRTFDLPRLKSPRVVIAIKGDAHIWLGLSSRWQSVADSGPYAITGTGNAPRNAGTAFLNDMRLRSSNGMISAVLLLGLSLLPLIVFLYDRTRYELIWLALHALTVSARRLQVTLFIAPDTTPFASAVDIMHVHYVLLLEFVSASLGLRVGRLRILWWAMVGLEYIRLWAGSYGWSFRVIEVLSIGLFVWAAVPRPGRRSGHWLILAGAVLVFYAGARTDLVRATIFQLLPPIPIADPQATGSAAYTLAMVLVLTRRLAEDRMEKQRLATDLEAARGVQNLLLTSVNDQTGEYSVDTFYLPAQEVGGDFYQVFGDAEGGVTVVVGDVSGKGLRAAMVVSMLTGMVRTHRALSPGELLRVMNDGLQPGNGGFVTCLALRVDRHGEGVLSNAGHVAPYVSGAEIAVECGLPLGVAAGIEYPETQVKLAPGEILTVVTDGVVEAANAQGELFGFDRTRTTSLRPAKEIAETAREWGQNDDITVVTVRRAG